MDGVNVGHTRCNVEQCVNTLASPRDRFCPLHQDHNQICAVRGCNSSVSEGFRTCALALHRNHEMDRQDVAHKAIFRLRARIRAAAAPAYDLPAPLDPLPLLPQSDVQSLSEPLLQGAHSSPPSSHTLEPLVTPSNTGNDMMSPDPQAINSGE